MTEKTKLQLSYLMSFILCVISITWNICIHIVYHKQGDYWSVINAAPYQCLMIALLTVTPYVIMFMKRNPHD